jgi:hypothetical protein
MRMISLTIDRKGAETGRGDSIGDPVIFCIVIHLTSAGIQHSVRQTLRKFALDPTGIFKEILKEISFLFMAGPLLA